MILRVAALIVVLAALFTLAAPPEWKVASLEVARYDAMTEPKGERGKGELVTYEGKITPAEGKTLVSLAMTIEVNWLPTSDNVAVDTKDIAISGDDQPGKLIGHVVGHGAAMQKPVKLSLFKTPILKEPTKQTIRVGLAGEVLASAKQVKLKIGDKEITSELPAKATTVDASEWMEMKFGGKGETSATHLTAKAADGNTLLKFYMVVIPKKASYKDDAGKEWFAFDTTSINVRVGEKVYPVVGYAIDQNVVKPTSYSIGVPYTPQMRSDVFPVFEIPAGSTKATLLWYGWPVSDIAISK